MRACVRVLGARVLVLVVIVVVVVVAVMVVVVVVVAMFVCVSVSVFVSSGCRPVAAISNGATNHVFDFPFIFL